MSHDFTELPAYGGVGNYHFNRFRVVLDEIIPQTSAICVTANPRMEAAMGKTKALMRNLALICAALTGIWPQDHGALAAAAASAPIDVSLAPYRASQGSPPLIDLATRSPQLTVVLTNRGQHTLRLWKDSCSWG